MATKEIEYNEQIDELKKEIKVLENRLQLITKERDKFFEKYDAIKKLCKRLVDDLL